jgi:uncharacterized protein DUF6624
MTGKRRTSARERAWSRWSQPDDEAFDLISTLDELGTPQDRPDDAELRDLFDQDQADRDRGDGGDPADDSAERDRERRSRGMAKLTAGQVRSPGDCYHLAVLLQHGGSPSHYQLAHELSRRAAAAGHPGAARLSAATHDRWLMHHGLPQKYGTQYVLIDGEWAHWHTDPATTDEERARFGVPPLADLLAHAEEMNS